MALRIKNFVLNNGPLLTTITIFFLVYFLGGQMYPNMQKPQVFSTCSSTRPACWWFPLV
jgi:hypothetical protein